jgi:cytochrome P450
MATLAPTPESNAVDPLDVTRPEIYRDDVWHESFARLRAEAPVYWCENSDFGPYWSVSTYKPIVQVESLPELYSSEMGGIVIADLKEGDIKMPMFIAMDRPKPTGQRRTVAPAFTPSEMVRMSDNIRARTAEILDSLPVGQEFDWVDQVSIELTTQMLAILFDFPWEDRRKLTYWSDWAGDIEIARDPVRKEERRQILFECAAYFGNLWQGKIGKEPTPDLISMMIHSDAMAHMDQMEFLGNLILLIVGGNDTTRNSMSAYAWGLEQFPDERAKLEANPGLIANATQEIIRWQTPLAHMRRTATQDTEVEGVKIREGDKLALWYLSANRDESVFP